MKKKVILGLCALLAVILLFPIPFHLKDGGTVEYSAVLYKVKKVHKLGPDFVSERDFLEGTIVEILGVKVFDNVR